MLFDMLKKMQLVYIINVSVYDVQLLSSLDFSKISVWNDFFKISDAIKQFKW